MKPPIRINWPDPHGEQNKIAGLIEWSNEPDDDLSKKKEIESSDPDEAKRKTSDGTSGDSDWISRFEAFKNKHQ